MSVLPSHGRAAERLETTPLAWLTTVNPNGSPQSSPVWFVVLDDVLYIRSRPNMGKLRNLSSHPQVSFHLDSDGAGGDILTVEGTAEVVDPAPDGVLESYLAKYAKLIEDRMNVIPEGFTAEFSKTIRLTPTRVRAW